VHKIMVCYQAGNDVTFDMEYYRTKHRELCFKSFEGLERFDIDRGVDGPYTAIAHLYFPSLDVLQAAMAGPNAGDPIADVPNYTNASTVFQISEVLE
jgi:uncharacterized protein (TIGR02118 family)